MRWEADIAGDRLILEQLARVFTGPQLAIVYDNERFLLRAESLDGIEGAADAKMQADSLAKQLQGAATPVLGPTGDLAIGALYRVGDDGSRHVYVFPETAIVEVRGHAPTVVISRSDGTIERHDPADPARNWMQLAQDDTRASKALRLLAQGNLSWVELYRLIEVVQSAVGKDVIDECVGRSELRRFKHTANSVSAAGDHARHGSENTSPPEDPMSLADARELIRAVLACWLSQMQLGRATSEADGA